MTGQFRLYCCGWTVHVAGTAVPAAFCGLLWLDSSSCTSMTGQFTLYCCDWTVHVVLLCLLCWTVCTAVAGQFSAVLQRLLCLDRSGCSTVAGQFRLYCCTCTVHIVLLYLDNSCCTVSSVVSGQLGLYCCT